MTGCEPRRRRMRTLVPVHRPCRIGPPSCAIPAPYSEDSLHLTHHLPSGSILARCPPRSRRVTSTGLTRLPPPSRTGKGPLRKRRRWRRQRTRRCPVSATEDLGTTFAAARGVPRRSGRGRATAIACIPHPPPPLRSIRVGWPGDDGCSLKAPTPCMPWCAQSLLAGR
eukprot:3580900-Rhodomonas_salina.3